MKYLLLVAALFMAAQSIANDEIFLRGQVSDEMLKTALATPKRYHFDDGGNIDFGNGFFKRRFNFAGQPQVCHEGNVLYGGTGKKCMKKIAKQKCVMKKTFYLETEMQGTKMVCMDHDGREDNLYNLSQEERFRCDNPSYVKFNRGPKVKVKIYKKSLMNGKADSGYIGYAILTIPPCDF